MEASLSSATLDNEDKALKSLLDKFGSKFSLEDIASAFCKASGDANVAGEILCGKHTIPLPNSAHQHNDLIENGSSSRYSGVNGNGVDSKALGLKTKPVSMGTVSSVLGKNYVWRPRVNGTLNNGNKNNDHQAGIQARSESKDVWSNGTSNGNKSSKAEAKYSGLSSFEGSLLGRDRSVNKEFENFLFEMLGQGFQLERDAIRKVLGDCGYDMKKTLETLLDLAAMTIDGRNTIQEGSNSHSNSETLSLQNQGQNQKFSESGIKTWRSNGNLPRQPNERYEQQKEVMTSLFHVPERPESTVSTPEVLGSARRYRATGTVVTEPQPVDTEEWKVKATSTHLAKFTDEAEDSSYQILRKAVKEYRNTMKEYYKDAAEAFACGDRVRASILLKKGQFFYNKAREADEESAQKIFETSVGDGDETRDEMCLDLQQHDPKEAIRLVRCHLRDLSGIPSISNLKIIIGMGEEDFEKRRRLVKKLLEKESIKWTEDENSGTILIRLDEINPKRLSFARK